MYFASILPTNNIIIIQTIAIGCLNLLVPLIFNRYHNIKNNIIISIAIAYFINIINIDYYYLSGGRAILEVVSIGEYNIKFYLEAIGLVLLTLIAFLWIVTIIYSIGYLKIIHSNHKIFFFFMNLSILCASLVALSANLFTSFIFYEILTISTIPLLVLNNQLNSFKALKHYISVLIGCSVGLLLPAIIIITHYTGLNDFTSKGIVDGYMSNQLIFITFLMCIFGCAKAALLPVHSWLPAAMIASHPVSALLHAVAVVKVGLFLILKMVVYIFGLDFMYKLTADLNWLILIPIFTILYSSLTAMQESSIKQIIAFSTISQLSFAMIGIFSFTIKGIIAAVFHLVAHSFSKITIFFAIGNIYVVTGKTTIETFKNMAYVMPLSFMMFTIASLSLIGVPPLVGFISKYYMLLATVHHPNLCYILLFTIILSTMLTASYFARVIYYGYLPGQYKNSAINIEYQLPLAMKFATLITTTCTLTMFMSIKQLMQFLLYIY